VKAKVAPETKVPVTGAFASMGSSGTDSMSAAVLLKP
jgi:hypothetical protein